MRTILITVLFSIITLFSCDKSNDVGNDPVRNDIGYLLSRWIEGRDTISFQYDNNNRLAGLVNVSNTFNYRGIYENFQYNSRGELESYKYTFSGSSSILSNVHNFLYQNDTIIKTSVNLNASYGDATKFVLSNDRIIETRLGAVSNGIILHSGFWDTTQYSYLGENIIKCSYRFLTNTYQPVDTFLYHNNFYNPYMLLEKHIWSLVAGPGKGVAFGESKNIPSTVTRATYNVVGTTLLSSGFFSSKVTAVESAKENSLLPKVIKFLEDDGSESIVQYFYKKQK
jgi:hypothetical protein